MHLPPPPSARDLLPPLLACLPTAFISRHPPPALLPLLSPLLRQRLAYLAGASAPTNDDGSNANWLPLLSWEPTRAAKLPEIVEGIELEPHPVSGELELEDVPPARYRRVDEETLLSRLEVEQFGLTVVLVWCEEDGGEEGGKGWKVGEVRGLGDEGEGEVWFGDVVEADEVGRKTRPNGLDVPSGSHGASRGDSQAQDEDEEDDDDYWASYDRTPGRATPAPSTQAAGRGKTQDESDYYSRYGAEVQPALDAHDPDEENAELGHSTLNGDSLVRQHQQQTQDRPVSRPNGNSLFPADTKPTDPSPLATTVSAPRPISPTDSQTSSVEKLEQQAAAMSGEGVDRVHTAIRQHICTDIKSLFRLARGAGMERAEFERVVVTQLGCLGFLEENE